MKLIVVDSQVVSASPSMRAWIEALPRFRHLFDEIEIWASECEIPEVKGIKWRRFPRRLPSLLHALDFERRAATAQKRIGEAPNIIFQCVGSTLPKADIRYMHFWNRALLEELAKRPKTFHLHPISRLFAELMARTEKKFAEDPDSTKWWWVVGRSISERIETEAKGGEFRILPNQYNPTRFHLGVRANSRDEMRVHYSIGRDEMILAFSAFGHFERKGLLQAVEAINILRAKGHLVRLLVIGGSHRSIGFFRKKLLRKGIDQEGCIFTGMVDSIERHLVAADGFFFPSNFEAFSLAEIEAAALGLRLYLTPHYGTEMILREPINGRLLPWDPEGMAGILEEDIKNGLWGTSHSETGEAIRPVEYGDRIVALYEEALRQRRTTEA
jgi:glycosyltransferase involved in cell wall biosynthesis